LVSSPRRLDLVELPYTFGVRRHGQSKLDSQVALEFAELILDKWFGRHVPVRFLMFATVGGIGLVLHLAVLWAALNLAGLAFAAAQAIATVTAMTSNFFLNNQLTYRDRRLRGWAMAQGLVSFYAICAVGAVANVGVGTLVYAEQPWWLLAGAAGALVGAGWNFAVSSIYTWQKR
jgi:dolichol-phosphate mannosyltransferase